MKKREIPRVRPVAWVAKLEFTYIQKLENDLYFFIFLVLLYSEINGRIEGKDT